MSRTISGHTAAQIIDAFPEGPFREFAEKLCFELAPEGRELSLALTKLEECFFWVEAARAKEGSFLQGVNRRYAQFKASRVDK
jgi:hypothetical protein